MSDLVLFQPVRALDRNGVFSPGALARFYEPGTTTARTVYTTSALNVAHPTPLVANASGVFPPVYTSGLVKAIITDADGVTLPGGNMDPAFTIPASGAGADSITFAATAQIPQVNVQAAIEGVDGNWRAAFTAIGLGITGSATLLANLDATGTASGAYRFDATTTGTRPSGWASGDDGTLFVIRQTATAALMLGAARKDGFLWARQMDASAWGAWYRVDAPSQTQTTWNTGTATEESTITPAKLAAALTNRQQVFHLVDQKADGTRGDATVATTWTTRTLNTTRINTITGASVAANVVTLPAGRYRVTASDPAYNCDYHRLRLYNVTAAAAILTGPNEYARSSADAHSTTALLDGFFTLSATSNVRLEHWCTFGSGSSFFGIESTTGSPEVYASIIFEWLGPA